MAKRKRPENETIEESGVRQTLEAIADNATRSEKVSWERKMDNMVSLLAKLKPIEEQILDIMAQKTPIIDEIEALRRDMVRDCVHPYHMLSIQGELATCKFCNKRFRVTTTQ